MPRGIEEHSEQLSRFWDYLTKSIFHMTAHASEARFAWQMQTLLTNFLYGHEGATYDAGLLIPEEDIGIKDDTAYSDRLELARKRYGAEPVILPIEFKHINPCLSAERDGGLYFFRFHFQQSQLQCKVVVVRNPAAPHLVACVPTSYLKSFDFEKEETKTTYYSPAFVIPETYMPESVRTLLAYVRGSVSVWTNPYNGISFERFKFRESHRAPLDHLFASNDNPVHDQPLIQRLRSACKAADTEYSVHFPDLRPCGGDFIIRHKIFQETYLVEMKLGSFSSTHLPIQERQTFRFTLGHYPVLGWDAILLVGEEQKSAVMLSMDEVPPKGWLQDRAARVDERGYEHEMTQSMSFWKKRTLNLCKKPEELGRRIKNVLNCMRDDGVLPRKKTPPRDESWRKRILVDNPYRNSIFHRLFSQKTGATNVRGTGRQKSYLLDDSVRSMFIHQQCQALGFGNLFHLGTHFSGTYIFCDGPYIGDTEKTFYDLELDTPMLFINFAVVDHLGRHHAHDDRGYLAFLHSTHGHSRSIYVLETHLHQNSLSPTPVRYLVPSETLATDERRRRNDDYIREGIKPAETYLYLSQGELLDCYQVKQADMVSELRKILRTCVLATDGERCTVVQGISVTGSDYVTTRRAAMEQFLLEDKGLAPWKKVSGERLETEDEAVQERAVDTDEGWYEDEYEIKHKKSARRSKRHAKSTESATRDGVRKLDHQKKLKKLDGSKRQPMVIPDSDEE